jgi:predicted  nucleic acid-binding Zn-ribbon protein
MIKNREGYLISETERECTKCGNIFNKTSKTVTLCNSCNSERVKCTSPEKKMLARAKSRARIKNIKFDLCLDDIQIPKKCPILGLELNCKKGSGGDNSSPALDRINPENGYTKNNIRVISHLANMMKSCANEEQLIIFANWINTNIPAKNNELS